MFILNVFKVLLKIQKMNEKNVVNQIVGYLCLKAQNTLYANVQKENTAKNAFGET